jgi:hypothetical protein
MKKTHKKSHGADQLEALTSAAVRHAKARKARALSELELAETVGGAAAPTSSLVLKSQLAGYYPTDILQTEIGVLTVSPLDVQGLKGGGGLR